jgi:hypothetical protein
MASIIITGKASDAETRLHVSISEPQREAL